MQVISVFTGVIISFNYIFIMIFSVSEPASDEHLNSTASYYLHISLEPSIFQSLYFNNFRHPYYTRRIIRDQTTQERRISIKNAGGVNCYRPAGSVTGDRQ